MGRLQKFRLTSDEAVWYNQIQAHTLQVSNNRSLILRWHPPTVNIKGHYQTLSQFHTLYHVAAGSAVLAAVTVCCKSGPLFPFWEFKLIFNFYTPWLKRQKVSFGCHTLHITASLHIRSYKTRDQQFSNTIMPLYQHTCKSIQNKHDCYLTASSIQILNYCSSQSSSQIGLPIFLSSKYKAKISSLLLLLWFRKIFLYFETLANQVTKYIINHMTQKSSVLLWTFILFTNRKCVIQPYSYLKLYHNTLTCEYLTKSKQSLNSHH